MSYINFKNLTKNRLFAEDVVYLQAIKQKETQFLIDNFWLDSYNRLEELNLIEYLKTLKKGDHKYTSLRLSKKGKQMLEDLEEAEVEEQDTVVFEWLKKHYLSLGKTVGNGSRTKRHLRDFRIKSGVEKNNLIRLFTAFLQDEDNMNFNNVLEYSLYKPPTAFQTRFNLEDSRLYKFYQKYKEQLDKTFEQYD